MAEIQHIADGVGYAVTEAVIQLREFSPKMIVLYTGASPQAVRITIAQLWQEGLLRTCKRDETLLEVIPCKIDAVRCLGDTHFCVVGPGAAYKIADGLLRWRKLTVELAVALTGTTRRRAAWELGELLAKGLADCQEREDKVLEVHVPEDQERLWELIDMRDRAKLSAPGAEFPWVENLWYSAALGMLERPGGKAAAEKALDYISRTESELSADDVTATPPEGWEAHVALARARAHVMGRDLDEALKAAKQAVEGFRTHKMFRLADSTMQLCERIGRLRIITHRGRGESSTRKAARFAGLESPCLQRPAGDADTPSSDDLDGASK